MTHGHQFGITIIVAWPSMYPAIIAARSSVRHPYARHTGTPSRHVYHNGTAIYEAQLLVARPPLWHGHHHGKAIIVAWTIAPWPPLQHGDHCGTPIIVAPKTTAHRFPIPACPSPCRVNQFSTAITIQGLSFRVANVPAFIAPSGRLICVLNVAAILYLLFRKYGCFYPLLSCLCSAITSLLQ